MIIKRAKAPSSFQDLGAKSLRANFRKIERREWWLWVAAAVITLLLTIALASFLLPNSSSPRDFHALYILPQAVRGLVALVFLFDLYTIYQHLQIHRIRRQLIEREELFHLISENAADMIAVVDLEGRRIFNSISYQKYWGIRLKNFRSHPGSSRFIRKTASGLRMLPRKPNNRGWEQFWNIDFVTRTAIGWCWNPLQASSATKKGEPEKLVVVNRDITERKKAQEALSRSEASFRALVEGAPHGIYRATMTGQFLEVNPALQRMLGYDSVQELLKADLATPVFRNSADYERMNELLAKSKKLKDIELEWKRPNGEPIVVRCSGHYVDVKDGAPDISRVLRKT